MNIYEKLMNIQNDLKAQKSQFNKFGKYNYRTLDDIYEALKPLLKKYNATLVIDDDLEVVNSILFRVSKASLIDTEKKEIVSSTMYTQEALVKPGMSPEQCSGSTASYSNKYCLNKLFCIDDTSDADTMDNSKTSSKKVTKKPVEDLLSDDQGKELENLCAQIQNGEDRILAYLMKINEKETPYFSLKEVESKDFKVAKTILEKQI